jgi:hypothetical protein
VRRRSPSGPRAAAWRRSCVVGRMASRGRGRRAARAGADRHRACDETRGWPSGRPRAKSEARGAGRSSRRGHRFRGAPGFADEPCRVDLEPLRLHGSLEQRAEQLEASQRELGASENRANDARALSRRAHCAPPFGRRSPVMWASGALVRRLDRQSCRWGPARSRERLCPPRPAGAASSGSRSDSATRPCARRGAVPFASSHPLKAVERCEVRALRGMVDVVVEVRARGEHVPPSAGVGPLGHGAGHEGGPDSRNQVAR